MGVASQCQPVWWRVTKRDTRTARIAGRSGDEVKTRELAEHLTTEQAALVNYLESRGKPMGMMMVVLAITMRMVAKSLGAPFQELRELVESTESLGDIDHAADCPAKWAQPDAQLS